MNKYFRAAVCVHIVFYVTSSYGMVQKLRVRKGVVFKFRR